MAPDPTTSSRLARSAASAGVATLTSRILGVVREQVVAAFFGAGAAMDAYNVAFRIPNLLRDLFAEGAMSAAFVPTFTRTLSTSGKEPAWRLGNHVINALIVVTGAVLPKPAHAWAEKGHRLVGDLAERQLQPGARRAVAELLAGETDPTLAGVA